MFFWFLMALDKRFSRTTGIHRFKLQRYFWDANLNLDPNCQGE